jgi:hypothetical protein
MAGVGSFEEFVPPALATLGIEADDVDLTVMRAAHAQFWPAIEALLELNLAAVPEEANQDLSQPPADA